MYSNSSRKLRDVVTSILVILVASIALTGYLSNHSYLHTGVDTSNSFINIASATTEDGGDADDNNDGDGATRQTKMHNLKEKFHLRPLHRKKKAVYNQKKSILPSRAVRPQTNKPMRNVVTEWMMTVMEK
jgi:hypothetical protein